MSSSSWKPRAVLPPNKVHKRAVHTGRGAVDWCPECLEEPDACVCGDDEEEDK